MIIWLNGILLDSDRDFDSTYGIAQELVHKVVEKEVVAAIEKEREEQVDKQNYLHSLRQEEPKGTRLCLCATAYIHIHS